MGMPIMSRGRSGGGTAPKFRPGDPQPHRFEVLELKPIGKGCVVKLKYTDCKNYEGVKILVYKNFKEFASMAMKGKGVDPHFLESGVSPIARFEPTDIGWAAACEFADKVMPYHDFEGKYK